jgi:arylsulfatase A-like enzyme
MQPATFRWTLRRSLGLLAAFAMAKLLLVLLRGSGTRIAVSSTTPLVLLHQDAMVVLAWATFDFALSAVGSQHRGLARATRITLWSLYGLIAAYAALNMPVALRLSTPLTHSMLGAVGFALSNSIEKYVTFSNVSAVLLVMTAAGMPLLLRSLTRRTTIAAAGALLGIAVTGAAVAKQTDTLGLHRNPLVALGATSLKTWGRHERLEIAAQVLPLPEEGPALDLTRFRGKAARRNVIWVILESTGARYIGSYGHAPDPTPRLSALAEQAIVFDNAHCTAPDSIKGLFSMLCSIAPKPYVDIRDYAADKVRCSSVATQLTNAGYRSALFHSGHVRYIGMQGIVEGRGFREVHDADSIPGAYETSFGIDDLSTSKRLLSFIDSRPDQRPFFAVYSPIAGHHPYHSPGPDIGPFPVQGDRDLYLNDLFKGDLALGHLADGIRERGLWERTLWVIVGDHGQAFQQHPGNFGHTLFVYEENTHVPFIIVAPGLIGQQLRAPQVVSLLDMAPTTLALLGLPIPSDYQGKVVLEPRPGFARFMTDHDLLKAGVRHANWKFLYESEYGRARLFDIGSDPEEKLDIAAQQPERAELYRRHVLSWLGTR